MFTLAISDPFIPMKTFRRDQPIPCCLIYRKLVHLNSVQVEVSSPSQFSASYSSSWAWSMFYPFTLKVGATFTFFETETIVCLVELCHEGRIVGLHRAPSL